MIQLESFHSITILANLRRLYFIVITDPRNTTVLSFTLEYVGQTFRGHIRSQAFRPEGNSFLSGELRYIDGSACDKGTPGTPPPLKQAAIPLASTYSSSSLCLPGTHSATVFNQNSIRSQTLSAKNPSTTSHISAQHSFLGNLKEKLSIQKSGFSYRGYNLFCNIFTHYYY